MAEVLISVARTDASGTPPWARTKLMAISPGLRRDPETMAPIASSTRCLVSSNTFGGRLLLPGRHHVSAPADR